MLAHPLAATSSSDATTITMVLSEAFMIKSPINRVSEGSVLIILGATMRGFHALQASSVMAITKCHFRAPVPTRRVESEQAEQLDRSALNPLLCIERVRRYLAPRPHRPPPQGRRGLILSVEPFFDSTGATPPKNQAVGFPGMRKVPSHATIKSSHHRNFLPRSVRG